MAPQLSKKTIIERETLREVAEARLKEAEMLFEAKHYAGTIYLAGYAVECYLKVAICVTLGWNELLSTFKVHDLEGLLLYSGFENQLRSNAVVADNFAKIVTIWKVDENDSVRYRRPTDFDEPIAKQFLQYISDPKAGVVTWLRKMTS